jgi:hypothetical protein
MARLGLAPGSLLLPVALVACGDKVAAPAAEGVIVSTNHQEYAVSSPPEAAFITVENRSREAVTVRRCLIQGSAVDPIGVDLLVEQEAGGTWRAIDLGFDCQTAAAPRSDAVLGPMEVALVGRLVLVVPGRFRARVAYARGAVVIPADTATSATFVVR